MPPVDQILCIPHRVDTKVKLVNIYSKGTEAQNKCLINVIKVSF